MIPAHRCVFSDGTTISFVNFVHNIAKLKRSLQLTSCTVAGLFQKELGILALSRGSNSGGFLSVYQGLGADVNSSRNHAAQHAALYLRYGINTDAG